jgi:hypothetical protein
MKRKSQLIAFSFLMLGVKGIYDSISIFNFAKLVVCLVGLALFFTGYIIHQNKINPPDEQ